jgi:hypothetical protein
MKPVEQLILPTFILQKIFTKDRKRPLITLDYIKYIYVDYIGK